MTDRLSRIPDEKQKLQRKKLVDSKTIQRTLVDIMRKNSGLKKYDLVMQHQVYFMKSLNVSSMSLTDTH